MTLEALFRARMAQMGRPVDTFEERYPVTCEHCGMPVKKGNETREECPTWVIEEAATALEVEAKEEKKDDEPVPTAP